MPGCLHEPSSEADRRKLTAANPCASAVPRARSAIPARVDGGVGLRAVDVVIQASASPSNSTPYGSGVSAERRRLRTRRSAERERGHVKRYAERGPRGSRRQVATGRRAATFRSERGVQSIRNDQPSTDTAPARGCSPPRRARPRRQLRGRPRSRRSRPKPRWPQQALSRRGTFLSLDGADEAQVGDAERARVVGDTCLRKGTSQ